MSRLRGSLSAVIAFLTVSIAAWSWGRFVTDPGHYRGPLLAIGVSVLVSGLAARALGLRWAAPIVQLAVGLVATSIALTHAPVPITGASRAMLSASIDAARTVISSDYPPVPVSPGIAALLLPGGMLAYWLTDLLACSARRAAPIGLVLIAAFVPPMAMPHGGVPWIIFVLVAAGFLALLALQESDRVSHWGRRLDDRPDLTMLRPGPVAVGAAATAVALVVPFVVPTFSLNLAGWGVGGNKGPITVTNPMVGMYGSLQQQADTPLMMVTVDGGQPVSDPSYLRIAVLNQFNGSEWSTGNRSIPTNQTASGTIPAPQPDSLAANSATSYTLTATASFDSRWLPLFDVPTEVQASGDWRYDTRTLDFIAAKKGLSTEGTSWTEIADPIDPSKQKLETADYDDGVDPMYTALPSDFPGRIGQIAEEVAGDQTAPFKEAVALQRWFTTTGGFHYSLTRAGGDSSQDLLDFITTEKSGYCQQFATAMAAMARDLGIPARVAVGFLHSQRQADGSYVFRGGDMHAWPELWFQGVGWVRFDPTPGVGATVPAYTQGVKLDDGSTLPSDGPTSQAAGGKQPSSHAGQPSKKPSARDQTPTPAAAVPVHERSWAPEWAGFGVVVAALLGAAQWWVRRRRRRMRLAGDAEDVWAELADTARDLRLPWPSTVSPRSQGRALARYVDGTAAHASLDRVVLAVERTRYAPPTTTPSEVGEDGQAVITALESRTERSTLRASRVLPRSLSPRGRGGDGPSRDVTDELR